jgi:hypothetical protein
VIALAAFVVAVIAWFIQAFGDGLENPWAWLFATLALIAAHLFFPVGLDRFRTRP